jgi:hypothetical protein
MRAGPRRETQPTVIPGRRAAANPESRTAASKQKNLDAGFALTRAPE